MKTILALACLLITSCSLFAQAVQYRPTGFTGPFVSTINDAASARTYLGVVTGLTNGSTVTNFTVYGLTINTGSTNNSLTASRLVSTDTNKGIVSSSVSDTNIALLNGTNAFTGTNRFAGTVLITNASSTISGNGAGLTNLAAGNIASGSLADARLSANVALLNGTNVMAGTNRFTGTVILTNAASTISGNGAGLTNLSAGNIASGSLADARLSANVALLGATNQVFTGTNTFPTYPIIGTNFSPGTPRVLLATNVGFFPIITNEYAAQSLMCTNNGLSKLTLLFDVRLPAVGANERVGFYQTLECTNVEKTSFFYQFYTGENTNYITGFNIASASGVIGGGAGTWIRQYPGTAPTLLFANSGSTTNQYVQGTFPNTNAWGAGLTPLNLVDTSTNGWRMMLGACHDGSTLTVLGTNLNVVRFVIVAIPTL